MLSISDVEIIIMILEYVDDISFFSLLKTCKHLAKYSRLKYLTNEYHIFNVVYKKKHKFLRTYIDDQCNDSSKMIIHGYIKDLLIYIPKNVTYLRINMFNKEIYDMNDIKFVHLGDYYCSFNILNIYNVDTLACELIANYILSPLLNYYVICKKSKINNKYLSGFEVFKNMSDYVLKNINDKKIINRFLKSCFVDNLNVLNIIKKVDMFNDFYIYSDDMLNVICMILQYIQIKCKKFMKYRYIHFKK